jgi:predicted Fe-Mo cluster-binding NifX family protein
MTLIAIPTDDGQTISSHLGQALFYVVVSAEEPAPKYEFRNKPAHAADSGHTYVNTIDRAGSSHSAQAGRMFEPIKDCQVLISGGMGRPAYDKAVASGLQVILTGERAIPVVLASFISGDLKSDLRRVHNHNHE